MGDALVKKQLLIKRRSTKMQADLVLALGDLGDSSQLLHLQEPGRRFTGTFLQPHCLSMMMCQEVLKFPSGTQLIRRKVGSRRNVIGVGDEMS